MRLSTSRGTCSGGEWLYPLDTPAPRRVLLYLIVPLASWLASALVQALAERAVLGP